MKIKLFQNLGKACLFATAGLCLLPLSSLTADIIAYEGFADYQRNQGLNGKVGSDGSGIAYFEGNNFLLKVVDDTLDYGLPTSDQQLDMSSGGTHLYANFDVSETGPFADFIDANGRIGKDGTTLYTSFLFRIDNAGELLTSGVVQAAWKFRKSASNSTWGVGQGFGKGTIDLQNSVILPQLDRDTHLVILKIEFKAGADTVTAWIDPLLGGAEEGYTPAAVVSTDASFDSMDFIGQGNMYFFDELRFGETFDDVTANIRLSAPATPVNFALSTFSDTELILTWNDLSLNENGFRIERALSADGPFTALPDLAADSTQFVDTGLSPNTEYFYRVSSFNDFGASTPTVIVSKTTLMEGQTVPAQPGSLSGDLVNRNISLSWTDESDVEYGYRVYRALGAGNYSLIAEIGAGSTSFVDSGRPVGQALSYRVTAFNELGESLAAEFEADAVPTVFSGDDWIWIEAENFASTTFPGNGNAWLSPRTSEVEFLSGGDNFAFLPNEDQRNAGYVYDFNIKYNIEIPQDGEYIFYVRRVHSYGNFTWRIDEGEWNYVDNSLPTLDTVAWRQFFPLNWAEGGSVVTTAGSHVLEIRVNPSVDFPTASAGSLNNYAMDCFLLTQIPFSPAGFSKPGDKYARSNPGQWPFEASSDPYTESVIDLSYLNEDVAGQDGWVTRRGSEFILGNGEKARFFGATLGDGTFSSYSAQARFLAKKGFNIARYHKSIDDRDEDSDSINNVDNFRIEQAQQFVAAFKQHGIYTNLSHFFILGHRVRADWDIPGYDLLFTLNKDRAPFGIFFWNEDFQNAYKTWVTEMLTRENPWDPDGTPLAEDPAIAMFEILNEDNLFFFTFVPSEYPEVQRLELEKIFGDWLIEKYGTLEAATAVWGGNLRTRDNLEEGRVEVQAASSLRKGATSSALRSQVQAEFMAELQTNFWTDIKDHIRTLGCEALVIPTNWRTAKDINLRDLEYYTYSAVDIIDLHNYFSPPSSTATSFSLSVGDVYRNVSAVDRPADLSTAFKQVEDRPSIISEFTWTNPTDLASEGPLITAAHAALQDIDGLFWFAYSNVGYDNVLSRFMVGRPSIMGQFPGTALLYRRGDIAEAPVAFREGRSLESLLKLEDSLIVQGSGFDPTRDTGFDPQTGEGSLGMETTLVGKVELGFGEDWDYLHADVEANADYEQGIFKSLTGQVEMNKQEGVFKVNSPLAQGVTSFIGNQSELEFDDCIIRVNNPFGAVLVISLDGLPIARSGKVLIQAAMPDETFGYSTEDALYLGQPAQKILDMGNLPFSMENIDGEVVLKGFTGATAEVLDLNGYPIATPISFEEGSDLRIKLPFNYLYTVVTRDALDDAPAILSTAIPSPVVGKPFNGILHASGGDGDYTWSVAAGSLPSGISLSSDGFLSGQTDETSSDPVTIKVVDGNGKTAESILSIDIISDVLPFVKGWVQNEQFGWLYEESPDWSYSLYMGWLYEGNMPWIYANPVGWMYPVTGNSKDGLWLSAPSRGWIVVSESNGGYYQYSSDGINWSWEQFAL